MACIPSRAVPLLLLLAALARPQADGGAPLAPEPVRLSVGLFKSDSAGTKFSPFKAGKTPFLVTVRLYDGPAGEPLANPLTGAPWLEQITVTSSATAASDPSTGAFNDPSRINGRMDLLLGASAGLPPDLLTRDAWFSTQVTTLDEGLPDKEYAESPRQPLGLRGLTAGQVLQPSEVQAGAGEFDELEAGALRISDGAATGKVLTSDAQGLATWQALPPAPGVQGVTGRLALFDSATA